MIAISVVVMLWALAVVATDVANIMDANDAMDAEEAMDAMLADNAMALHVSFRMS